MVIEALEMTYLQLGGFDKLNHQSAGSTTVVIEPVEMTDKDELLCKVLQNKNFFIF